MLKCKSTIITYSFAANQYIVVDDFNNTIYCADSGGGVGVRYEDYLECIIGTIIGCSSKVKNHIKKDFKSLGIEIDDQMNLGLSCNEDDEASEQLPNKILEAQLISCLQKDKKAIKSFESWEFKKDYKYSVVFEAEDFDSLIKSVDKNEVLEETEQEYTSGKLSKPVYFQMVNMSFLKFNLLFSAFHPQTGKEMLVKYPLLVVFHKQEKIIEFRFDVLKKVFIQDNGDNSFYASLIQQGIDYLQNNMQVTITPIDLNFIIDEAKKQDQLKLVAQYMKLTNGGNAQLDVGNNQEYVLPFIGELKSLLADYEDELKKVPVIKEALEQFVYEKEEKSDYPWIEVLWKNEIKTRSIRVKLTFNYMGHDYCLMQHYYNNALIGMERMNHVVNFINTHRNSDSPEKKPI